MKTTLAKIGDMATWTCRDGSTKTGTIVRIHRYPWCPGANEMTVYSEGGLYGLGFAAVTFRTAAERGRALAAARAEYEAQLVAYPVWAERVAAGEDVTAGWAETRGVGTLVETAILDATITTDPDEIKILDPGFRPEAVEGAVRCDGGCGEKHLILPDGYYVPPRYKFARAVAGRRITIALGMEVL